MSKLDLIRLEAVGSRFLNVLGPDRYLNTVKCVFTEYSAMGVSEEDIRSSFKAASQLPSEDAFVAGSAVAFKLISETIGKDFNQNPTVFVNDILENTDMMMNTLGLEPTKLMGYCDDIMNSGSDTLSRLTHALNELKKGINSENSEVITNVIYVLTLCSLILTYGDENTVEGRAIEEDSETNGNG